MEITDGSQSKLFERKYKSRRNIIRGEAFCRLYRRGGGEEGDRVNLAKLGGNVANVALYRPPKLPVERNPRERNSRSDNPVPPVRKFLRYRGERMSEKSFAKIVRHLRISG